jgi:hypothetical protein
VATKAVHVSKWMCVEQLENIALTLHSAVKTVAYQCEVPAFWGINFQDPSAANAAPPNIGVDVSMELVESTACADMMTGLGAVAGKFSTGTQQWRMLIHHSRSC